MFCLKCNAELEPIKGLDKEEFYLRYGGRDQQAFSCPNGCPGLWTETSLESTRLNRIRIRRKQQLLREEL